MDLVIAAHPNLTINRMNFLRKVNVDVAALGLIAAAAVGVLGEAATRTSLGDAQTARECRYPPLSSIITRGE
jgi:hypothetical protein